MTLTATVGGGASSPSSASSSPQRTCLVIAAGVVIALALLAVLVIVIPPNRYAASSSPTVRWTHQVNRPPIAPPEAAAASESNAPGQEHSSSSSSPQLPAEDAVAPLFSTTDDEHAADACAALPETTVSCMLHPGHDDNLNAHNLHWAMLGHLRNMRWRSCHLRNVYLMASNSETIALVQNAEQARSAFEPAPNSLSQPPLPVWAPSRWMERTQENCRTLRAAMGNEALRQPYLFIMLERDKGPFNHHGHAIMMNAAPSFFVKTIHGLTTRKCRTVFLDGSKGKGQFDDRFSLVCDLPAVYLPGLADHAADCGSGFACLLQDVVVGVGGVGFHSTRATVDFRRTMWSAFRRTVTEGYLEAFAPWAINRLSAPSAHAPQRVVVLRRPTTAVQVRNGVEYRTESHGRYLINVDEVIERLRSDFPDVQVVAEELERPLVEQVLLFHNTTVLVTVEGSAFDNVVFGRRGMGVLVIGYGYDDLQIDGRAVPLMHDCPRCSYTFVEPWCSELHLSAVLKRESLTAGPNFAAPLSVDAGQLSARVGQLLNVVKSGKTSGSYVDWTGASPYACVSA
jgi:hypothetical protein